VNAGKLSDALGGRKQGRGWMAPCPTHADQNPSLSIHQATDGTVLVHCHAGCNQEQVVAALRCRGFWPRSSQPVAASQSRGNLARPIEDRSVVNRKLAAVLWQEAIATADTMVTAYLLSRNIAALSAGIDGRVLRFHPCCPYGNSRHPCLLAIMRDVVSDDPRAIQRTAFAKSGEKIGRLTLGPKTGAAIKLSADEDVATGLVVGEGLETVLRGMQLGFNPAWSLGDAGNLRSFPVLSGVECLTIIVDNDENGTGQQAALECSKRWIDGGQEVFRIVPERTGDDLNDVIQRALV
jgi:putative DNA primase/helicase